jgi:uncharacterized protein YidB (DUF937 family)
MGLFDSLAKEAVNALSGRGAGQQGALLDVVASLLGNPQTGGLQGLIQAFERQGLGNVMSSWISTGQNLPVSAEQLQSVLGSAQLQSIAQAMGMAPQELTGQLSQLLPQVVDRLTPDGAVPESGALQEALGSIGKLLGR